MVYLSKTLTLQGGYTITNWSDPDPEANPTTLDAGGQGRVLFIGGSISATVEGLRITGGDAAGLGGGISYGEDAGGGVYAVTATVSLRDNEVFSNTSYPSGGGLAVYESSAVLDGNTISANTAYLGSGLYLERSEVTFERNTVSTNTGTMGGGLYLLYSTATFAGNFFVANTATSCGGGLFLASSAVTLSGDVIMSNTAESGGGLNVEGGPVLLNGTAITANTANYGGGLSMRNNSIIFLSGNAVTANTADDGGGLYLGWGTAFLDGNTIVANSGWRGGAIYAGGSVATLVNNIIAGNWVGDRGSGLYVVGSGFSMLHNTIARNRGGDGSGVYVTNSGGDESGVNLVNTILVSQTVGITVTASNWAELEATLWGSGPWANGTDWGGEGTIITGTINLWEDPLFVDPDGGDYHIGVGSPAVDAGVDAGVTVDIDGEPRPMGHGYDIGADEVPVALTVTKQATPDPVASGAPLTYTLRLSNTGLVTLRATISDVLPAQVTPTGVLTWTAQLVPGDVWSETVVVTVELGYIGPLTNVVRVNTEEGATGTYTSIVTVEEPIAGLVAANDSPTPLGYATTLSATVTAGSNVTYAWAFGDGGQGGGSVITHTYSALGVYTALVTASNGVSLLTATTPVTVFCQPPVGVDVEGPQALPTGQTGIYQAAARPITASLPLSFTWDNGTVGPTAAYSWTLPGVYTVTVTATNACGQVQGSLTVTVLCQPIHKVVVSGPAFLLEGQTGIYTASYAPPTATLPVTFTWDNGTVGPTAAYSWTQGGFYTITVTATNACGEVQGSFLVTILSLGRDTLVLALLAFDNDLSPYAPEVIERFARGTAGRPDLQVILLVDQKEDGDSQVVLIANGVITTTGEVPWLPGIHELDTASPETIASFLTWAGGADPLRRTVVALVGHGVGPAPEVHPPPTGTLGLHAQVPPLPQFRDRTSSDLTSGTYLSTPELGRALAAATGDGAAPFDLLFLDQCFEGSLDVLYEVRDAAEVLLASPNYAWAAFAYDRYLARFTPTATPEELAQAIVEEYQAALDETHPNAILWLRGADLAPIAAAVSGLADALRAELGTGSEPWILQAALAGRYVDTTLCAADLALCPPDELIGLGSFARELRARFPGGSPVHAAAGAVLAQLANVHGAYRVGQPWVKPEVTWAYTDTLTILAPLTPSLTAETAWRASIYTSTVPLEAVWAPQPTRTVAITVPLAYTVEGRWDEFIAAWYDPLTPTVGQQCRAAPPALVISDSQLLTLTVEAGLLGVYLEWGAATDPQAVNYGLFVLRPDGVTWEMLDVVPLTQTSYLHGEPLLPSGWYSYLVAARDAQGYVLALSEEASAIAGISAVLPDWGYDNVATTVSIQGAGFGQPLTVTVGGVLVEVLQVQSEEVTVVVPAGWPLGVYDVAVATPAGQALAYDAYRVIAAPAYRFYLPLLWR